MLALLATLLAPMGADTNFIPSAAPSDPVPAIQITFDNSAASYAPGQHVSVRVQTRDDGYVIVFRVDGDGRIQTLFPLDPDLDAFVRGGKQYEIRGRGDQDAFMADAAAGTGMIYAAVAREPFVLSDFVVNRHWDYGALRLRDSSTDAEADLTEIVSRMTNHARFDYDAAAYHVQQITYAADANSADGYYPSYYDPYYNPSWRCMSCGWGYPRGGFNLNLGLGYDPYYYDPFFDPFYSGFGFGFGYGNIFGPSYPVFIPVGRRFGFGGVPVGLHGGRPRPRTTVGAGGLGASGIVRPATAISQSVRPRPSGVTGQSAPVAARAPQSMTAPGAGAVRVRPRGNDMMVVRRAAPPAAAVNRGDVRPVFREPPRQTVNGAPQTADRSGQPARDYHPAYREPPRPQPASGSPASSQRGAPPPRSAPPPSRGGGGGASASHAAPARGGHR